MYTYTPHFPIVIHYDYLRDINFISAVNNPPPLLVPFSPSALP